ncbi:acetylcholine receptor subunit beta-like 2 [Contarinia nasturtii]|uniref:acetylcholine receptor subunit beta-like 2 n=1 Tax=Contarinia nasturtii TaxID=265458 RepID=UPI0012D46338|nr:acetylcholine receptor subunit beta-like 2 [Contarinia nasturtii]
MYYHLILLASACFIKETVGNKFNVSYAELQFCKEYDVKSGYKYTTFFHIESLKPNRNIPETSDTILNLKIFVLAAKDAHILLSPTDQIKSSPIYEIVLGAGGNTFNEIRRQRQSQPLKTMRMKNFLSQTDVMPLTVVITKSGNISITITGQSSPFLSAFDPNVLDIKYISFSTWGTAEAKYFYDCESDSIGNKLAPIKQNLTDNQRLENDILREYDANVVPNGLDTVMLDFNLVHTYFNAKKSYQTSRGKFRASWIDGKLVWEPSKYGGKSQIYLYKIPASEIVWTPQIRLLNGKDDHFTYVPLSYTLMIFSNGSVWAETNEIIFSTWCLNSHRDWPYEKVNCSIQIHLDHLTNATLIPLNNVFNVLPKNFVSHFDESEWRIIDTKATYTLHTDAPYVLTEDGPIKSLSILKIDVILGRNNLFYNNIISMPLIGAYVLILLSFWVDKFLRVMLNAISLFILMAMLLVLVDHGPTNYTPTVVVYYTSSMFVVWASLFTFTMHCWFKEQKPNIELFTQIASYKWAQLLAGTDTVDTYYDDHESNASGDFFKVIDRLWFFICLIIFVTCIAVGY